MRSFYILALIAVLSANFQSASAQNLEAFEASVFESSQIKGIQSVNGKFGIAYTGDRLFGTTDDGGSWTTVALPLHFGEKISSAFFENESRGFAVLFDRNSGVVTLLKTEDSGRSWGRTPAELPGVNDIEADAENAAIAPVGDGSLFLTLRISTSSNFTGSAVYRTYNDGASWQFSQRSVELWKEDSSTDLTSGQWRLSTEGTCAGRKTGCVQETRIYTADNEITPPEIKALSVQEKESARRAVTPMFALPPGGTTRISLNRGFDKCVAGSVAQMRTWWNTSPHYDSNIYFSGRNRACPTQPLNTTWTDQVTAMGWGLIPTVVGYQSPCTASTTTAKLSYDPATAEQQGRGEANIAVTDATNIGLTTGSILYYDMERYDETSSTPGCRTATVAFLKGWTDRIKELGYKSGVYGSPKNAQEDWMNIPVASRMDAVWLANWDNIPSVWRFGSFPTFPTNVWDDHQRIKQWQAPHNETWGGVTFNIDGNIADGPVAGIAIRQNKNADFDGDGKTDVSIFRPSTGEWFVLFSSNSTFNVIQWGSSTDIITPGDYDGDGKTDYAVFRPSDGNWYLVLKAGFVNIRQWGTSGDIPVPSDYNNDGKTDIAVFRPSNGTWYIAYSDSRATYGIINWGIAGDKPVPEDYDGDGKTDIAVYRPSQGTWYVFRSSDNDVTINNWGNATDLPVPGDYGVDQKADYCVYRDGTWYIYHSSGGVWVIHWGNASDQPMPGDFDGNGQTDFSVYRPSEGNWYFFFENTGASQVVNWGNSTDKPVPAAYRPQ